MHSSSKRNFSKNATALVLPLLLSAVLSACGGGGGSGTGETVAATTSTTVPGPSTGPTTGVTSVLGQAAVRAATPAAVVTPTLVVRARVDVAGGNGGKMTVRVDGAVVGTVMVRDSAFADYAFAAPTLQNGSAVDVVFSTASVTSSEEWRSLFIGYLTDGAAVYLPATSGVTYDRGEGDAAFDGLDTLPGQSEMWWGGALRLRWRTATADPLIAQKNQASRLLQQATFGPTVADVEHAAAMTPEAWVAEQQALPYVPDFGNYIQAKYDRGDAYRPHGDNYTPTWIGQRFFDTAANSRDQLRKRVAYAMHQLFMASQVDTNLFYQARPYAAYLDTLSKHAFGNYRNLLEEIALSPVMGIYMSHMRNRKEDPSINRTPDENYAREMMQLCTIGLYELNQDGSNRLDANGRPIETYTNADVMAMAKVFTGWSWAFPDNELSEESFLWFSPDTSAAKDKRIDMLKMKSYPGQHSTAEKRLFAGKAQATTIPANGTAESDLKLALDALFNHPNVGPFVGRQLIQRLTTSNPSPAYVARVAAAFANNGQGVRGDLGAVVRAVLLDAEARQTPAADFGVVREPILRITHWMRSFAATSASGEYMLAWDLDNLSQRAFYAPSVFGYFRPGYVPPNTSFSRTGATAPEFQIVNESTTASWVNTAQALATAGYGWNGNGPDVTTAVVALTEYANKGDGAGLIQHLNLLLFAGRMSTDLRQDILDAVGGVANNTPDSQVNRARVALLLALASPEYLAFH